MGIDKIQLSMAGPSNRLAPKVGAGAGGSPTEVFRKSFGEPIPKLVDISNSPFLQALFSQQGVLGRIRRKLVLLSGKKGRFVPAKGTVASALSASEETQGEDLVFVGVEFLAENHTKEDLLAGILAHEWGHLVSEFPHGMDPDQLTWEEIFTLRKEEEAAADGYAGKMLYRMNNNPEALIQFFLDPKNQKESTKYHPAPTRVAIIRAGYQGAKQLTHQARRLIHPGAVYHNPITSQLIAVI